MLNRENYKDNRSISIPGNHCALCGRTVPREQRHSALLPDSSVSHPADPNRHGWRTVIACGKEHLDILIRQALEADAESGDDKGPDDVA